MSTKIGIVGMPNAGKSSLFNALTKAGAEAANYPFTTIEPNIAVVPVPDARLNAVAETVGRFDGFVAKYMGDGVLIYFGYPQAHEDDAERAVRAGLAVIETVGRLPAQEDLRVRLGSRKHMINRVPRPSLLRPSSSAREMPSSTVLKAMPRLVWACGSKKISAWRTFWSWAFSK